jgi:hypothetical protein
MICAGNPITAQILTLINSSPEMTRRAANIKIIFVDTKKDTEWPRVYTKC